MRIKKVEGLLIYWNPEDEVEGSGFYDEITQVDKPTVRYYYDGQMCIEEDSTENLQQMGQGPLVTVTRYAVGARGIDWMWKKVGSGTPVVAFPIYDGHGNMVYTLSRGANDTFSLGNKRIYGAWGDLRYDGNPGDGPNTQYCANLGHKLDDESGLTYMRARYYEPWTGRFVSEDPARDGWNWFVYCVDDPINFVDESGRTAIAALMVLWKAATFTVGMILGYFLTAALYQAAFPGYQANFLGNILTGGVGVTVYAAADLWWEIRKGSPFDRGAIFDTIKRSLAQTGYGPYRVAGGIFFLLGLAIGVSTAAIEFLTSGYEWEWRWW